jgi:dTDP-4-amino-4,6-dideoxygalactose transaminase
MKPYISARPSFEIKPLFNKRASAPTVFPFDQQRIFYSFSGRYAFASLLKALSLGPNDSILLPSYNCGVEIDPVIYFRIRPKFYKVKSNMDVDLDDISQRITRDVKALIVTHFLGFAQPIRELRAICADRNIFLVEDCAHAFLSDFNHFPLGSYGDAAFFSLLKTLPVPNGGFYIARLLSLRTRNCAATLTESAQILAYKTLSILATLSRLSLTVVRKILNAETLTIVRPDSYDFHQNLLTCGISPASVTIINDTDLGKVKSLRRRNFEYILKHFLKFFPEITFFDSLPNGVCPLFFPVILPDEKTRQGLYHVLKSRGIITHPWWDRFHPSVPWNQFPDAVHLKQCILGLPIHQNLTPTHLDRIISEFEYAYSNIQR